jgi:lambda family phage tail tape measure protein
MPIGSLVVEVSANTVAFSADMGKIAQIAETSMRRTEQAQKIATAASDRFVAALKFQADTFGKTDVEILRYKADLLGAGNAAAPLIAQIEQLKQASNGLASGDGIRKTAHEMENVGFKTAGAKRELLVLAHELSQGNFSRFGGSLLVLGERTGAAALLFSAAGLAAISFVAALGAFAVAAFKGASESDALGKSLQLTGNYAGITEGHFNSMARAAAGIENISIGKARDAFGALAASGQFTSASLQVVGVAALAMAKNTGAAAEDVAKEFVKMADGVTKYADEHNKQYHFLTAAQYEHIRTLEDEGQKQLAMIETGKALIEHFKAQVTNLGFLERAWDGLKSHASSAWDQMLGLGRNFTVDDKLAQVTEKIRRAGENVGGLTGMNPQAAKKYMDGLLAEKASFENERNRIELRASEKSIDIQVQDAGVKASKDLKEFSERYASKKQQADKEIKLYKDAIAARTAAGQGGVDSEAQQQAVVASIREKFAERGHKGPKDDPTVKELAGSLAAQEDFIAKAKKQSSEYQKDLDFYVHQQYLSEAGALEIKKQIIEETLVAEEAGYAKELAAVDAYLAKAISKTQRADGDNKRAAVLARQVSAETDAANQIKKVLEDRGAIQRKFDLGTADVARQQGLANDSARFQIDLLGKSTLEVQKLTAARQIQLALDERIRKERELDKNADVSVAVSQAAEQQLASEKLIEESYHRQREASFGAAEALRKYGEEADNTGAQIENSLTGAFKAGEDAFLQFTTTGKLSFSSLAQSIIADLERILIKKAIAGLVNYAVGAFTGGGGGGDTSGSQFSATGSDIAGRRATGGPVGAGGRYLVGENGPEILSMGGSSGSIVPNDKLGGGSVTVINNFNGDGSSSSKTSGDNKDSARVNKMIVEKIREVLVNEKRNGGLLA